MHIPTYTINAHRSKIPLYNIYIQRLLYISLHSTTAYKTTIGTLAFIISIFNFESHLMSALFIHHFTDLLTKQILNSVMIQP